MFQGWCQNGLAFPVRKMLGVKLTYNRQIQTSTLTHLTITCKEIIIFTHIHNINWGNPVTLYLTDPPSKLLNQRTHFKLTPLYMQPLVLFTVLVAAHKRWFNKTQNILCGATIWLHVQPSWLLPFWQIRSYQTATLLCQTLTFIAANHFCKINLTHHPNN